MNKNRGDLRENSNVTVCMADTGGDCVWSYEATYKNGWFDHGKPWKNKRHDTLEDVDGCYAWYIVSNKQDYETEYGRRRSIKQNGKGNGSFVTKEVDGL